MSSPRLENGSTPRQRQKPWARSLPSLVSFQMTPWPPLQTLMADQDATDTRGPGSWGRPSSEHPASLWVRGLGPWLGESEITEPHETNSTRVSAISWPKPRAREAAGKSADSRPQPEVLANPLWGQEPLQSDVSLEAQGQPHPRIWTRLPGGIPLAAVETSSVHTTAKSCLEGLRARPHARGSGQGCEAALRMLPCWVTQQASTGGGGTLSTPGGLPSEALPSLEPQGWG